MNTNKICFDFICLYYTNILLQSFGDEHIQTHNLTNAIPNNYKMRYIFIFDIYHVMVSYIYWFFEGFAYEIHYAEYTNYATVDFDNSFRHS